MSAPSTGFVMQPSKLLASEIASMDKQSSKTKQGRQYDSPPASVSHYVCLCKACEGGLSELDAAEDSEDDTASSNDSDEQVEEDRVSEQHASFELEEQFDRLSVENKCRSAMRLRLHLKEVTTVLLNCPEIATLHVGESKKPLACHKAILALHSEFFDAALYGNFIEGTNGNIDLPEESPDEIAAFLSWIYSGTIESKLNAVQLWVLGDRLRIPFLCNDVMYLLFNIYGSHVMNGGQWLSASTVEYVYAQTHEHSLLRLFVRDVLRGEGPLCDRALESHADNERERYIADWNELIYAGGDLVVDVATVSSFKADHGSEDVSEDAPYLYQNHHKYLMDTKGTRPVEDFVNGIRR